ncbi:MAG: hypothetical protein ACRCV0_02660 [Brevinema sp.]
MSKTILSITLFLLMSRCSSSFLEEVKNIQDINLNVSYNTSYKSVVLSWDEQNFVSHYEILRGTSHNNLSPLYQKIITTELQDQSAFPSQKYFYQVKGYSSDNTLTARSKIKLGYRSYYPSDQVQPPLDVHSSYYKYRDKIQLNWVGNDDWVYRIYRSIKEDGTFIFIKDIMGTTFIDEDISTQYRFFYKIATLSQNNQKELIEKYFPTIIIGSRLVYPTGLKATQHNLNYPGQILLTWDSDPHVSSYQIYRSQEPDANYQMISYFVTNNKFVDSHLPSYKKHHNNSSKTYQYPTYYYQIRSFKDGVVSEFSQTASGSAIDPQDILDPPTNLKIQLDKLKSPYYLNISWDVIPNASAYHVTICQDLSTPSIITVHEPYLSIPAPLFNSKIDIIVQAFDIEFPEILGSKGIISYTRRIPSPPLDPNASSDLRIDTTNIIQTNAPTVIYVNNHYAVTGIVTKVWTIHSKVGMINVTWQPNQNEIVDYYNIYRSSTRDSKYRLVGTNVDPHFSDMSFSDSEYQLIQNNGTVSYPQYYYKITAVFLGEESSPSSVVVGSAIDPKDILPSPSYLSIPFHWASGTGYGDYFSTFSKTIKQGSLSPVGINKITTLKERFNFLYTTWDTVFGTYYYRIKVSKGSALNHWRSKFTKMTYQRFNNENVNDGTGLYLLSDFLGYSQDTASFEVTPIKNNKGLLIDGETIGILFEEPQHSPSVY